MSYHTWSIIKRDLSAVVVALMAMLYAIYCW